MNKKTHSPRKNDLLKTKNLSEKLKKEKKIKNDKELDKTLENTFPASDATAKY